MSNTRNYDSQLVTRLKQELFVAIEKVMEKDGLSQAEVARRIGAQRYNINKVMRRKSVVSVDFLLKVADGIGLKVELRFKRPKA